MKDTLRFTPKSYWIHCASPFADQRVKKSPSTVLAGTLPSSPLAVTSELPIVNFVSAALAVPGINATSIQIKIMHVILLVPIIHFHPFHYEMMVIELFPSFRPAPPLKITEAGRSFLSSRLRDYGL
jgi:hypothetical protein